MDGQWWRSLTFFEAASTSGLTRLMTLQCFFQKASVFHFAEEQVPVSKFLPVLLQTHINFPRFLPIFPDFLERLSHLAPIY
jgi:hypothetical protein